MLLLVCCLIHVNCFRLITWNNSAFYANAGSSLIPVSKSDRKVNEYVIWNTFKMIYSMSNCACFVYSYRFKFCFLSVLTFLNVQMSTLNTSNMLVSCSSTVWCGKQHPWRLFLIWSMMISRYHKSWSDFVSCTKLDTVLHCGIV